MSIQSMTGFGKAEKNSDVCFISVEIKSVNNRYQDIQFKIPKNLTVLEPKLRSSLEKFCHRGSFTCFIQYNPYDTKTARLELQEDLLEDYLNIVQKISEKLNTQDSLDISGLLKIPELVQINPIDPTIEVLENNVLPVFEEACEQLMEMRVKEGERLIEDIKGRVEKFVPIIPEIKNCLPTRQKEFVKKLKTNLNEILKDEVNVPEDRISTEIGIIAERLDITEELVRLEAHVKLFQETVQEKKSPGKRLTFILQEMLREVNTMSNKSQYIEIQHHCVRFKEEIEKVREQVMNIE